MHVMNQIQKTKSEWFVANNLLKDLLNQLHLRRHQSQILINGRGSAEKKKLLLLFFSSTNDREDVLKDGVQCLPFKENDQLPSDIVEALRQAEENDDYEFA